MNQPLEVSIALHQIKKDDGINKKKMAENKSNRGRSFFFKSFNSTNFHFIIHVLQWKRNKKVFFFKKYS